MKNSAFHFFSTDHSMSRFACSLQNVYMHIGIWIYRNVYRNIPSCCMVGNILLQLLLEKNISQTLSMCQPVEVAINFSPYGWYSVYLREKSESLKVWFRMVLLTNSDASNMRGQGQIQTLQDIKHLFVICSTRLMLHPHFVDYKTRPGLNCWYK